MRGFNLSDKPAGIKNYRIDLLVEDVLGLIKYFGKEKAAIVAHDWGPGVAWALAHRHPEAVSKLGALQVPPPAAWRAERAPRQLARAWDMFLLLLLHLYERWARPVECYRHGEKARERPAYPG